jgi:hypothetical protein
MNPQRITWDSAANPHQMGVEMLLYKIRKADGDNPLLLDSVSMADILEGADSLLAFDALVTPYAALERKMNALMAVMKRAGGDIHPVAMQISDPFKQNGVAQVAAVFELSDGQTVSIFFHNPDVSPQKIGPGDELISWKWLLNKRDVTILVAPERGQDLNVREVAARIMKLAAKNSQAFQRANTKRAESLAAIEAIKGEIVVLEKELADAQHELEVAKVEAEDRAANAQEIPAVDPIDEDMNQRYQAVKAELQKLGWQLSPDGVSLQSPPVGYALVHRKASFRSSWRIYKLNANSTWSFVREIPDKTNVKGYAQTPAQFARSLNNTVVDLAVKDEQNASKKAAFVAELEALKAETDINAFNDKLDEIAFRIKVSGLMNELDAELNAAADQLTALLAKAERQGK